MTYEEYIEKNGSLTYSNVGVSMLPLLRQGRDLFTIEKSKSGRYRKYDAVLYRRPHKGAKNDTQYVLHRIIEVRPDSYVILGDNCVAKEYGIKDSDILGRMVSITRNGRTISCDSPSMVIYSRVWVTLAPVRIFAKRAKAFVYRRIKRKGR